MSGITHKTQCYIPQELNHSPFHCLYRLLISSFSNPPGGLTEGWIDQAACLKQPSHNSVFKMFMAILLSLIFSLFCTVYSEFTFLLPLSCQHTQVAMEVTWICGQKSVHSPSPPTADMERCVKHEESTNEIYYTTYQATDFLIIQLVPLLMQSLKLGLVGII